MESTEKKAKSQDRRILSELSMADVYDFLQQEEGGKRRAIVLLESQYRDAIDPESKTAHLSRQYLLDRGFGKAPQAIDLTSKGEQVTAGIFIQPLDEHEEEVSTT